MYTNEERRIFKYFDGTKEVQADPIALYRALVRATSGCFDSLHQTAFGEVEKDEHGRVNPVKMMTQLDAQEQVVEVVNSVLGLTKWSPENPTGRTEGETITILGAFSSFIEGNDGGAGN